jgi:hypothetical protein
MVIAKHAALLTLAFTGRPPDVLAAANTSLARTVHAGTRREAPATLREAPARLKALLLGVSHRRRDLPSSIGNLLYPPISG